ncbi:MAG: TorF family putative porin [Opitutaceae bacterium]|nr:TorF family putative porin [Opitutaceae bacterium]
MTSKLAALVMCTVAAANVFATGAQSPNATATSTIVSDYVFRGQRLAGTSVQPMVEFVSESATLALSGNAALQTKPTDVARSEVDLFGSYRFALSPRVGLRLGGTLYFYPEAPGRYRRSIAEPNVALDYTIGGVRITPTCYYDLARKGATFEASAAVALPLKNFGIELDLAATVGTYRLRDAFNGRESDTKLTGDYWLLDASMPWQITASARITIGVSYAGGANSSVQQRALPLVGNPLVAQRCVFRVGYTHMF